MSPEVVYAITSMAGAWFLGYGFGLIFRSIKQFLEKSTS
jgi:hypothetical protein